MDKEESLEKTLEKKIEEITALNSTLKEYNDIISNAGFGVWHIILKEGKEPRMQVNDKMAELLDIDCKDMSEEAIYSSWYDNVMPEAVPSVQKSVGEMISGKFSENTYKWKHPKKGVIYVRCGGTAVKLPDGTDVLRGYHADVTEIVKEDERRHEELEKSMEKVSQAYGIIEGLCREYHTIWVVDKKTLKMSLIRSTGKSTIKNAVKLGQDIPDFDSAFEKYIDTYVAPEDRERMHHDISSKVVLEKLKQMDLYTVNYLRKDEDGHIGYHQIAFANSDVKGDNKEFVYGFRDVDNMIREEQEKNNELMERLDIINTISKSFKVIYYVDLKDYSFVELGVNVDGVREFIGDKGDSRVAFNMMCKYLVVPEMADEMKVFTDVTTLKERLKNKEWISHQFKRPQGDWSDGVFIAAKRDENGNFDHAIWGTRDIDELKKNEANLIYKSNTDELTGLYNRRAYEDALSEYEDLNNKTDGLNNFVYVAADINGLKKVNDNLGHAAGDELIVGASDCLKKCFRAYGKIFRTGGDEFIAMIFADENKLEEIKNNLQHTVEVWSGRQVENLSISCGYVSKEEFKDKSVREISILADKRMYKNKAEYYKKKGIDRRG